jgi:hypothetical protein
MFAVSMMVFVGLTVLTALVIGLIVLGILLGTMSDGVYGDWCRDWDDFCDR